MEIRRGFEVEAVLVKDDIDWMHHICQHQNRSVSWLVMNRRWWPEAEVVVDCAQR